MANYAIREIAGTPTNGTTAVYTLTVSGSSGTYRLGVGSQRTSALAYNADATAIQAALRALSNIGSPNVTVSGGGSPFTITMAGTHVKTAFGPIEVRVNSTNGTVSIAETTPGVTATHRTAPYGAWLVDSTTGNHYYNRSTTTNAPDWTLEGARSLLSFPIALAKIADGDILTTFTPGFAGKIVKFSAITNDPATTALKTTTLNLEIGTTNLTGGVLVLTSANQTPLGKATDATAITGNNTFTSTDTISIEAASTTAFIEGSTVLYVQLQANPAP